MREVVLFALLGCGRVGFDARADGGVTVDDVASPDAAGIGGPAGTVMRLDGIGAFAALDAACDELPGARTVTAWIEAAAGQNGQPSAEMIAFNDALGNDNLSLIQWGTDASLNYYDDFISNTTYLDNSMPAGTWTFVAFTIDAAGNGVLYRDATVAMTFTTARTVPTDGRLSLGQEWDGVAPSEFFAGRYDAISVWNHVRTAQQLDAERRFGVSLTEAGLVAHYDFEGSNGNDAVNDNDAFLVGNVTFEAP